MSAPQAVTKCCSVSSNQVLLCHQSHSIVTVSHQCHSSAVHL